LSTACKWARVPCATANRSRTAGTGSSLNAFSTSGDKLIPTFLTAEERKDHGEELEKWRSERFKSRYLPLIRPFSAVPDLLQRVREAGKDELNKYLEIARISGRGLHQYNQGLAPISRETKTGPARSSAGGVPAFREWDKRPS
jgi:hypothetical protein